MVFINALTLKFILNSFFPLASVLLKIPLLFCVLVLYSCDTMSKGHHTLMSSIAVRPYHGGIGWILF